MLNLPLRAIVSDWQDHAQTITTCERDPFALFIAHFVTYNALYSEVTRRLLLAKRISSKDTGDRQGAVGNVAMYLTHQRIADILDQLPAGSDGKRRIQEKAIVYEVCHHFYIFTSKTGTPDRTQDEVHVNRIAGGSVCERVEALLTIIYKTRCNLFHGGKKRLESQAGLLNPMSVILNALNSELVSRLGSENVEPDKEIPVRVLTEPAFVN
jgi:hypothetical protein